MAPEKLYEVSAQKHCMSTANHTFLTFCIAWTCQLALVRNMMGHIKSVSDFFNVHPKHFALLQQQIEENLPPARHSHLLDACRTRWISRIDGLDVFVEIFVSAAASLEIVMCNADKTWSPSVTGDAHNHFLSTIFFEFIDCLIVVAYLWCFVFCKFDSFL